MIAIILAAGYATRLYPITLNQPKPLLKVSGKPIVEHIINKVLSFNNIEKIYIITNNKFYTHFSSWLNQYDNNKPIKIINDQTQNSADRLGAIGDINFVIKQEQINEDILIVGGDNLFEDNLNNLFEHFKTKGTSILLNDVIDYDLAKLYGVVSLNENNQIIEFSEKPKSPKTTLISTLIYALKKEHLPLIGEALKQGFADRAGDFISYLSKKEQIYGLPLEGHWFDIGSLEQLKKAEEVYK
jgi:glucose-1-phosphate thymidylyltransferase